MIIGVDLRVLGTGRTTGVEEYTSRLVEHMLPLEPRITFKLFSAGRRPLEHKPWMDGENVRLYPTDLSNRLLWARTHLTGRPFLDELVGGADVFFFPHFLLGATSPKCKRVMTWHDLSYERMPELFSLRQRFWHRFQMRPRAQAASADRIIAVSESTRADLMGLYKISPERITTVHSGIDPSLQRPTEGDLERYRVRSGLPRRFILALGTREPRKNLDGLVAAFDSLAGDRRFADVHLVIVGPDGWLWRPTAERIRSSRFRTRIHVTDPIAVGHRALLLSSATVLAYPSLLEGFGFPALEAMACGTPVVAAANSSLWETVGDAGLLVDPYSVDRLSRALATVLDDGNIRTEMARRGLERAATFSWNTTARRSLDVIVSSL